MKKNVIVIIFVLTIFFTCRAWAGQPDRSEYLDGGRSNIAVILCHGQGKYPRWLVVDPLRKGINKELGFHTLSLQMPVLQVNAAYWKKYADVFPVAYKEIEAAIAFLRKEKGVKTIYLMGHSMGSRMATAFLANHPDSGIKGFIGVGIRNGGPTPLDSNSNLRKIKIPVLDIFGDGGDGIDGIQGKDRADLVSTNYKQILIPGADHLYSFYEDQMVKAVVDWLRENEKSDLKSVKD